MWRLKRYAGRPWSGAGPQSSASGSGEDILPVGLERQHDNSSLTPKAEDSASTRPTKVARLVNPTIRPISSISLYDPFKPASQQHPRQVSAYITQVTRVGSPIELNASLVMYM